MNRHTTTNTITVNSTLHTVPIGIILTLQPSINKETNEITLNVRPTLSRITSSVSDPAVAFLVAQAAAAGTPVNIDNKVPVIEVRELDSILKLKSGRLMLVYNGCYGGRTPLSVAISDDGGKTYPRKRNLVEGPGDFGYPQAFQARDGKIHVVYTSEKRRVVNHATFDEEWVTKP